MHIYILFLLLACCFCRGPSIEAQWHHSYLRDALELTSIVWRHEIYLHPVMAALIMLLVLLTATATSLVFFVAGMVFYHCVLHYAKLRRRAADNRYIEMTTRGET